MSSNTYSYAYHACSASIDHKSHVDDSRLNDDSMAHISLLQDLLALDTLPNELYQSLTQHLAILPPTAVTQLLTVLLQSSPALDHSHLNAATAQKLHASIRKGLQGRIVRLLTEQHSNWTNRRRLAKIYALLCKTVDDVENPSTGILRPVILSALAASLRIKDAVFIGSDTVKDVESALLRCWRTYLLENQSDQYGEHSIVFVVEHSLLNCGQTN